MQKRDFETYQKRFRDFEIQLKFSETHLFRGTIRHPYPTSLLPHCLSLLLVFSAQMGLGLAKQRREVIWMNCETVK